MLKALIVTVTLSSLGILGPSLLDDILGKPGIAHGQPVELPPISPTAPEKQTVPPVSIFSPLPSQGLTDELNRRAMEAVRKSPIRSNAVIGIHHVTLNEKLFFDTLLKPPTNNVPPVAFQLSETFSTIIITERLLTSDLGLIWSGHIHKNPRSSGLFRVDTKERTISGEIRIAGTLYEIRPGEKGSYVIFTIDTKRLPPDHSKNWSTKDAKKRVPAGLFPPATEVLSLALFPFVIDVMVLYTQNAINADPSYDIARQVCDAMTQAAGSFLNSGITNAKLRLVHHERITFPESGSLETDAINLRDPTNPHSMSTHTKRSTHGADLVSLWVGDGDDCGRAEAIIQPGGSGALAFSVVRRNCATAELAFAHELGHLMGAYHDRFDAQAADDPNRNYGYTFPEGKWRTIMGLNRKDCQPACSREIYWSNPAKSFPPPPNLGSPMGRPDDAPRIDCRDKNADPTSGDPCDGPANNVVTLNNNAEAVSKFTPTGNIGTVTCSSGADSGPPAVPSGLDVR